MEKKLKQKIQDGAVVKINLQENKIVFDVTTLKDAAEIIKNIYGYEVIIKDESLSTKNISGILPNDNLEVLLKALEATNDFKIKTDNKTITIEPTN